MSPLVTFSDIVAAAERIQAYISMTPILSNSTLNDITKASIFFKCENFQLTGAFKLRGAMNAVLSLDEVTAARGVATHSSGNHAAGLAFAAKKRGIPAYIAMPNTAPALKKKNVIQYGAHITYCEVTLASRLKTLDEIVSRTGAHVIPPYDDARVIAGQGTAALELLQEKEPLDIVMTPIGGGGLISGSAIACHGIHPHIQVIGAEPQNANDAQRSLEAGHIISIDNPHTMADGLRTSSVGTLNFAVMQSHLHSILTVTEEQIKQALLFVWEELKMVIEPSSAVPVAAIFAYPDIFRHKNVGVILSGGNVDVVECVRMFFQ